MRFKVQDIAVQGPRLAGNTDSEKTTQLDAVDEMHRGTMHCGRIIVEE